MDIKFSVILYSKYSKFSKALIETMEKSNVDFVNQFQLKLLCIDNEVVRKRILNNKQIDIKTVPCILIVYNDGGVEKYEDTKAFEWVEQIIAQFAPPPQPIPAIPQNQPILEEDIQVIQNIQNEDINDVSVQQEKAIKRQQNKIQKKQDQQQKIKNQQSQQLQIQNSQLRKQKASNITVNTNPSVPQNTSIDDLLLDDNENQDDFDMNNDDIDMYINDDPPTMNQVESTNALSVKRNDLMSLASSMQKSRDTFVEKTEKPKFNTLM